MILKGIITQHTTDEVFVDEIYNPTLANLDAEIDSNDVSKITITSDNEIFDSGQPARWYTANNVGDRYAVVPINRKQIQISMYTAAGVETSNILNNAEFEI